MDGQRSDRKIILFLVAAILIEAGWLTYDIFKKQVGTSGGEIAGHILRKENHLLIKTNSSLSWDVASINDELFYHDSVMTLSQSGGKVYLQGKTEVSLSENTMITIDPPLDEKDGQIRLKLSRGDLRARNPFATTQITHEDWSLKLDKGSDIDIRQMEDERFQILVKEGEIQVNAGTDHQRLLKNQLIEVSQKALHQVQKISSNFSWEKIPSRIYAHALKDFYAEISWQGDAQSLQHERQRIDVTGRQSYRVPLRRGRNNLQALTADGVSSILTIELWEAPTFHLIEPLPRSRVKTNQSQQFIWQSDPRFSSYQLQFRSPAGIVDGSKNKDAFANDEFNEELDLEWQVKAFDQEGFEIPPLYSYPLFIRDQPFSAPQLKKPFLRRPAQKKSSRLEILFSLLLKTAQAKAPNSPEAIFSWEPVDGADHYVIEISETPDFRVPLINEKISTSQFKWPAVKMKKYYWRVAAGSNKGRLGIFSESVMVDFKNFTVAQLEELGVAMQEPVKIENAPVAIEVAEPTPPPTPAPAPITEEYHFSWEPYYSSSTFRSAEGFTAKIRGGSVKSFSFEYKSALALKFHYEEATYRPDPAELFPFQSALTVRNIVGQIQFLQTWGFKLKSAEWFERVDTEKISPRSELRAGIYHQYLIDESQLIEGQVLLGESLQEVSVEYRTRWSGKTYFAGPGVGAEVFANRGRFSEVLKVFIVFGFSTKP